MKRKLVVVGLAMILSSILSFPAFASWEQAGTQWKYKDDTNNVYVASQWIESASEKGLWYYLDENGLMATDKLIDDLYYVNELGEWREGSSGGSTVNTSITSENQNADTSKDDWRSHTINDISNVTNGEAVDESSAQNFLNNR